MLNIFKRLALGLSLIVVASAILLISDEPRRTTLGKAAGDAAAAPARVWNVALLQMASQPILDDGAAGVMAGLAELGFTEGKNLIVRRFNAEGDTSVVNTMAQEITHGNYDLVVTLSTLCLQAMANANKQGRVPHLFAMVTDPRAAGVGIGEGPLDHPAHLTGIGTMPPATESLELAKQINPKLARIGVVWNPAEINSEISTRMGRAACAKLKMELLEANAENTASVREAAVSLISRGVDALWIGGDVTVLAAVDVVVRVATEARIPVFTCIPGNAAKGTLFDVGANYFEVGRRLGQLASRVLQGAVIAQEPVTMAIPPKLILNQVALAKLTSDWSFPPKLLETADSVIDEQGQHDKPPPARSGASSAIRPLAAEIITYVSTQDVSEAIDGLRAGLKAAGCVEGEQLTLNVANAQGDMATLNTLVDACLARQPDLLLTVSSQAVQSAVQRSRATPVVFTMVANPFLTGIGTSDNDHLPLVTGAYGANDVDAMIPIIKQLLPNAKRVGALYAPAEVNSEYSHRLLVEALQRAELEPISVAINSPAEVPDAAQSLCTRQLDLICLPNSNLAGSCFPSIARAAQRAKLPVFGFLGGLIKQGATVVLTRDFYDMGFDSGKLAARVLRGERPAEIPFHPMTKSRLLLNPAVAAECQLVLPDSLLEKADQVIGR